MDSKSGFDKALRSITSLAKTHGLEADLIIDGSRAIRIRLKEEGGKPVAYVRITDIKKVLTTPELVKAGLSFLALKKQSQGMLEVRLDTGFIKKLFGKKS